MKNKLKIHFETIEFENSHGRAPRGRGCWAFADNRKGENPIFTPYSMTYKDAKKWLKESFENLAHTFEPNTEIFVYVLP